MKLSSVKKLIREVAEEELYGGIDEARFTKMHYVQIAKILSTSKTAQEVGEKLIPIFQSDNPLFDENKFRVAARLAPGVHTEMTLDANHQFDPMDKSTKV